MTLTGRAEELRGESQGAAEDDAGLGQPFEAPVDRRRRQPDACAQGRLRQPRVGLQSLEQSEVDLVKSGVHHSSVSEPDHTRKFFASEAAATDLFVSSR
jgi:hypothetical protein